MSNTYDYSPVASGYTPSAAAGMGAPTTPAYLQQQNNPSAAGAINNMVRALMAGYRNNPSVNGQGAWGNAKPVPYTGSGPFGTGAGTSPDMATVPASMGPTAGAAPAMTNPGAASGMMNRVPSWINSLNMGGYTGY
jgi:hypothetical protein